MKNRIMAFLIAVIVCFSGLSSLASGRDLSVQELMAQDLKALGLFKGVSETEFELGRAPSRIEAVIMLIRALGKDAQATEKVWTHQFADVPDWADNYVGYAYANGLSNGLSDTKFGTENASIEMFLTFILRSLGYSDKNGEDFVWDNPFELAKNVGIYPQGIDTENFLRADVVAITYSALGANLKNSDKTLSQKLIDEGVFTDRQFRNNYDKSLIEEAYAPKELTAEQIYEKCSPAVFYIEVADKTGYITATGSGFFIDSEGTAVTNYHVIEGAVSATATLAGSGYKFEILGVYDYSKENDWAVIKVAGSGFTPLKPVENPSVAGGATVYAIGSPLGLQNTISQGIVSNPEREIEGKKYIQTSAAISQGSSGGALINKYGEVIGITSAKFSGGENLGLAIPVSMVLDYNGSAVTSLEELLNVKVPNSENFSREENAYLWLAAFITANMNTQVNGYPAFELVEQTENGVVTTTLVLQDGYIAAGITENYNGSYYFCAISLEPGEKPYVYYTYEGSSGLYGFKGTRTMEPEQYYPYDTLYFDEIEGNADEDLNAEICGNYVTEALAFVEAIFGRYISEFGDYSVVDFGFVNFER